MALCDEALYRLTPADRMVNLLDEGAADVVGLLRRLPGDVRHDRARRRGDGGVGQDVAKLLRGRRHERRMERAGHLQPDGPLRPPLLSQGCGAVNGLGLAGQDDLLGAVEVGRTQHLSR